MSSRPAPSSLLIDVFHLASQGGDMAGTLPVSAMERLRPSLSADDGELRYRYVGFMDDRGRPAGRLSISAAVRLVCDRCSRPVELPLASESTYYFVASARELGRILVDEADEEPLLGSTRFDLAALIEDDAILALPMSPRHDACESGVVSPPGLAGQDAGTSQTRHPFADLAKLKRRRT